MKNAIMVRLSTVANALNYISVSGKNNLKALAGCMDGLEEVLALVSQATFLDEPTEPDVDERRG